MQLKFTKRYMRLTNRELNGEGFAVAGGPLRPPSPESRVTAEQR